MGRTLKPIKLRCYARPEGNHFVAVCITINVASQNDTLIGAIESLREAVEGYLESVNDRNISPKRISPVSFYLEYYIIGIVLRFRRFKKGISDKYENITWVLNPTKWQLA